MGPEAVGVSVLLGEVGGRESVRVEGAGVAAVEEEEAEVGRPAPRRRHVHRRQPLVLRSRRIRVCQRG